jgi:putative ABC transport system permease protein
MNTLWQDLRYAVRMLWKNPGMTMVAIIALALGIGANTAIFSVVNAVVLRPLPYHEPHRLVRLTEDSPQVPQMSISYPNFLDWREQNRVFESIAAMQFRSLNLIGTGEPERLPGRAVSADFFDVLGVRPAMGRSFASEEDRPGANRVCIISHGLWQRRFGSDANIIGKQFNLSGDVYTVIGVLPANYRFGTPTDVFVPIGLRADQMMERGSHPGIYAIARLKPGVTVEQARSELVAVAERISNQHGQTGNSATLTPLQEAFNDDIETALYILLGAVGFVLLIACANVANLLLARAASRAKEIAIRTALGAGRRRLIRQLLTESVLLAFLGGGVGLLLALWGVDVLRSASIDSIPPTAEINLDGYVLAFTLLVSLGTGIGFGLAPALGASKIDLNDTLKEGGRSGTVGSARQRIRSLLVVSEIALSLVLLIGAGLLVKNFWRIQETDPGFKAENLMTMQISRSATAEQARSAADFFTQLTERIKGLPGVEAAAFSDGLPFLGASDTSFAIEGRPRPEPGRQPQTMLYITSPDYLRAMNIQLVRGRFFTDADTQRTQPVAVIDEAFARQQFPNEDPIGQRIAGDNFNMPSFEIVGVVAHVRHFSLDQPESIQPQLYLAFNQAPDAMIPSLVARMKLIVRTAGSDPLSLSSAVRREVLSLDTNQPIFNINTMEQTLDRSLAPQRLMMMLLVLFALVALMLSAIGIYGVMSYLVAQRKHEIGIRMALGAQPRDVLRLIVGQGMTLVAVGLGAGLIAAFALTRVMASLLYGTSATDPVIFASIPLVLAFVAFLANYIPARRATKVDPTIALRYE